MTGTMTEINKRTGRAFNDGSEQFIDWTDQHLIESASADFQDVYVIECYGVKDMLNMMGAMKELKARGYRIDEEPTLSISKEDTDE